MNIVSPRKLEARGRKPEDGSGRPEAGGPKPEARSQRLEPAAGARGQSWKPDRKQKKESMMYHYLCDWMIMLFKKIRPDILNDCVIQPDIQPDVWSPDVRPDIRQNIEINWNKLKHVIFYVDHWFVTKRYFRWHKIHKLVQKDQHTENSWLWLSKHDSYLDNDVMTKLQFSWRNHIQINAKRSICQKILI